MLERFTFFFLSYKTGRNLNMLASYKKNPISNTVSCKKKNFSVVPSINKKHYQLLPVAFQKITIEPLTSKHAQRLGPLTLQS